MSFIRGGETITVKRRSQVSTDDYGNPTYTLTTITIKDALVAFGSTDEPVDASRDPIDNKITIYLPNGTVIQPGDLFIIRNTNWVQDGESQEWISPFTSFDSGTVVQLRKRIG
jgi:hypothetical protein